MPIWWWGPSGSTGTASTTSIQGYQFSDLYSSRLDRELGTDDSTVLFTTGRRKNAINEGVVEFVALTQCYQRRSSITIQGGTAEYDLNNPAILPGADFADLSKIQVEFRYTDASSNVTVLTGDDLLRRDVPWLDRYSPGWQTSTVASSVMQLPTNWYLRTDGPSLNLGFTPVPSTGSSASAKVFITYMHQPELMISDTQAPFSVVGSVRIDLQPYVQGIVHYGAAMLEKLRRDDQASDRQMQKFMGYVSRYLTATRVKGGRTLSVARSYFGKRAARV